MRNSIRELFVVSEDLHDLHSEQRKVDAKKKSWKQQAPTGRYLQLIKPYGRHHTYQPPRSKTWTFTSKG